MPRNPDHMPTLKQIGFGFVGVLVLLFAWLVYNWVTVSLRASKKETKSVVAFHESAIHRETGKAGQKVATQPKAEVSKATFKNLTRERIRNVENESGLELGNVSSITETGVSTVREVKAPLVLDTISPGPKNYVRRFHVRTRFGTMSGKIEGDSISIRDSISNPILLLETRPKWKLRHLWPWNWGARKREVKLLLMNPDSKIDTLSNISIVP